MDWFGEESEREAVLLEHLISTAAIEALTDAQRSQALVTAVRQQNSELAKSLLACNASPNSEDEFGCTAVMFAATFGLYNCLESMLAMPRCVVNKRSQSMQTALHFAAKKGQVLCVDMLVNNGAMINVADDWGETPLMLGVRSGSLETVQVLLGSGARLEMTNLRGMDGLMYAAQGGHAHIMMVLLNKGCLVNKVVKSSALHQAALYGHVTCTQLLLDTGARPDIRDIHGTLPIELATHTDKHMVVECLLDHGMLDEYKNMALASAAKHNGILSVEVLLGRGADPGAVDWQGLPAFFWAVAQNNVEITKCLIRHNVDVNKTLSRVYLVNSEFRELSSELDLDFVSAVVLAAFRDYRQLVQILVLAGADTSTVLRLWEQGQLPQSVSTNTSLVSWLAHRHTMPRSLAALCRHNIRSVLPVPAYQRIRELPLPRLVQDYLNYADLDVL